MAKFSFVIRCCGIVFIFLTLRRRATLIALKRRSELWLISYWNLFFLAVEREREKRNSQGSNVIVSVSLLCFAINSNKAEFLFSANGFNDVESCCKILKWTKNRARRKKSVVVSSLGSNTTLTETITTLSSVFCLICASILVRHNSFPVDGKQGLAIGKFHLQKRARGDARTTHFSYIGDMLWQKLLNATKQGLCGLTVSTVCFEILDKKLW